MSLATRLICELAPLLPVPSISSEVQDKTVKYATGFASSHLLEFEKKEVTFHVHPLQSLYLTLEKIAPEEKIANLELRLKAVPETVRNEIFFEVWNQATDAGKGGEHWGEHKASDDYPLLLKAIKSVVDKTLLSQPQPVKNVIYSTLYKIAGEPKTSDLKWGETNAHHNTLFLIRALHRHQCLGIRGKEIAVYSKFEKGIKVPSQTYHLERKELERGRIGYHNGMATTLEEAKSNALQLSDHSAQGYNIHGTYGATVDFSKDLASAILGQGGITTPPVLLLLDEWQNFIEQNEWERYLQVCNSRGTIEVHNALQLLPKEIQQRIIVIAVAPACLIPQELAYKVINLVVSSDSISKLAVNRHLMDSPHTRILERPDDRINTHSMHGSSFQQHLVPLIDSYIRTNDI